MEPAWWRPAPRVLFNVWRDLQGRYYCGHHPRRSEIIDKWREELRELAASLESRLRRGADALERLVDRDPYHIAGYRGYGRDGRVLVLGPVSQGEGPAPAGPGP